MCPLLIRSTKSFCLFFLLRLAEKAWFGLTSTGWIMENVWIWLRRYADDSRFVKWQSNTVVSVIKRSVSTIHANKYFQKVQLQVVLVIGLTSLRQRLYCLRGGYINSGRLILFYKSKKKSSDEIRVDKTWTKRAQRWWV